MQGGWDPEFGDCRPGTIMTADVVRWGIEHGFRVYEFLAGEQEYKRRWADSERTFVDVVAANPSTLRGRLYARRPCLRGEAP
jgi:CelD/BcsL family acetyltransferase involved in cellulose biosynthesis